MPMSYSLVDLVLPVLRSVSALVTLGGLLASLTLGGVVGFVLVPTLGAGRRY